MQINPVDEWQRLTAQYRQMTDEELQNLAIDFTDLTDAAQQVLRSELKSRGLGETQSPPAPSPASETQKQTSPRFNTRIDPNFGPGNPAAPYGVIGQMPKIVPDDEGTHESDDGPREYTWKTVLCDCEANEQAQELSAALRQAGIDSWIQQSVEYGRRYGRILVAADQLDQARFIAGGPISKDILDSSKEEVPEFVEPKCPACGAEDPILEGVDPANTWRCEQCGKEWMEPLPGAKPEVSA